MTTRPTATRLPDGGWRITLPLAAVPSANLTTREHWSARNRRVSALATDLLWLLHYADAPRLHTVERHSRVGNVVMARQEAVVFDRARLALTLYFPRRARRDPGNFGQGGGAKGLVDALVRAGWLADDDAAHLTCDEPRIAVDRERPRVEIELHPWDGER